MVIEPNRAGYRTWLAPTADGAHPRPGEVKEGTMTTIGAVVPAAQTVCVAL